MIVNSIAILQRQSILYPLAYMGLIYFLSSIPGGPNAPYDPASALFSLIFPSLQNVLHVPLYGLLALLWSLSLGAWSLSNRLVMVGAFGIATLYGVVDEWHQLSVPGRYASPIDCVLNTVGAVAGIAFYHYLTKCRNLNRG